jgi:hypothetical protein
MRGDKKDTVFFEKNLKLFFRRDKCLDLLKKR